MLYIRASIGDEDFVYALTDGKNVLKTFTEKDMPVIPGREIEKYKKDQLALQTLELELLQQENVMLQMSVMELSSYAASQNIKINEQDERLQTQENALMELSMLVAGGGA